MKRISLSILALIMAILCISLPACTTIEETSKESIAETEISTNSNGTSNIEDNKKEDEVQGAQPTNPDEPTKNLTDVEKRALEKDNLPEWVSTKFQGRTIKTYSFRENFELDANGYGEITGDTVYDLVYKRNKSVEERLGIKIENVFSSTADTFVDYSEELSVMARSLSDEFPIIYTMGNSAINSDIEYYYFSDVSKCEYLSLDSSWWRKDAMEALSFDSKDIHYLCGDITITTYNKAGAIFVNSTEYNLRYDEGLDGLYDLVIEGGWTIEELSKRAKENYDDIYADGLDDDGRDFIGFSIGSSVRVKALEYGFDVRRWSRDEEGFVKLDFDIGRADKALDRLIELLFENPGVYFDVSNYVPAKSFALGKTLFFESQLGTIMTADIRDMEEDFGVLPTPKLDINQQEYMTEIQESSSFVVIPVTCQDTEFASIVVEALCAESYRTVILPYLEKYLDIQYVSDSRVGKNIDIILDSATKDYFGLYNPGGIGKLITNAAISEVDNISEKYVTLVSHVNKILGNIKVNFYS